MQENMTINTANGRIVIHVNEFFPCSKKRFRELFKVVHEFSWCNNVQEMTAQLERNFRKRITEAEAAARDQRGKYLKALREWAKYRDIVDDKRHPNGAPLTKDELKDFRGKRSRANRQAAAYYGDHKKEARLAEGLKKNLNMLEHVGWMHGESV